MAKLHFLSHKLGNFLHDFTCSIAEKVISSRFKPLCVFFRGEMEEMTAPLCQLLTVSVFCLLQITLQVLLPSEDPPS